MTTHCPNCGATLKSQYECEYCGSVLKHREEKRIIHVVKAVAPDTVEVAAECLLDLTLAHHIGFDNAETEVKRRIAEELVCELVKNGLIEIVKSIDYSTPFAYSIRYRGSIRVKPIVQEDA